ncbi:TetR/AcrR family transcriptional regulator [Cryptosporangium minutisporangium]|uniref:TetR/AcrR family transcriptional regulator n=1 Tax=Cryptosporangium minutisporangium TaxID=113569 RepID=A0ABP6SRB7_9ACTN
MSGTTPKQRLLDAVVDAALDEGISDRSLRAIAESAGTSHRMLIHHFGSREGLLTEVVKAVEQRQRDALADFSSGDADPVDAAKAFWKHLCAPQLAAQERLFFEVYGQALQGRAWAESLVPGVVSDWIGPLSQLLAAGGVASEQAPVHARLALAVTRGLLLDLLATGEADAVDEAMALFARMVNGPDPS